MASTTGTEDQSNKQDAPPFGFQVSKAGKGNIRGSQDLTRDNNILSPLLRSGMPSISGDESH